MYLLKTDAFIDHHFQLVVEEFQGERIPQYAILSHTWQEDEVLFDHIKEDAEKATKKRGFAKVRNSAKQALRDGYRYIWIDTCCIDKRSSAELSEAINSMFSWYKDAAICYAYLEDVSASVDIASQQSEFATCKWFTRGWCLQELLAPKHLVFFSYDWIRIGEKSALTQAISNVTGIDQKILANQESLSAASVAMRMSWAALRKTTRVEDLAYCLMGIFSVNMPMLYGEGSKAFYRLQEEIIKHSDDQSIFAWVDLNANPNERHGLLADSPAAFAHSARITYYQSFESFELRKGGLRLNIPLLSYAKNMYRGALYCPVPGGENNTCFGIYLQSLASDNQQYARVRCNELCTVNNSGRNQTIYVRQKIMELDHNAVFLNHYFCVREDSCPGYILVGYVSWPPADESETRNVASNVGSFRRNTKLFQIQKQANAVAAAIMLRKKGSSELITLLLGSLTAMDPAFDVVVRTSGNFAVTSRQDMQAVFKPQPLGETIVLPHCLVKVDASTAVNAIDKLFTISILIEHFEQGPPIAATPKKAKKRHRFWRVKDVT